MKYNSCCDDETQQNMPVQEIETGNRHITTCDPPDARYKCHRDQEQRKQSKDRAAIPTPEMDEPWPDASSLAPHQQQKPEAAKSMQYENEPLLWMARYQADDASHNSDSCGERNAPGVESR